MAFEYPEGTNIVIGVMGFWDFVLTKDPEGDLYEITQWNHDEAQPTVAEVEARLQTDVKTLYKNRIATIGKGKLNTKWSQEDKEACYANVLPIATQQEYQDNIADVVESIQTANNLIDAVSLQGSDYKQFVDDIKVIESNIVWPTL